MFYRSEESHTIREMPDYFSTRPRGSSASDLLAVCGLRAGFDFHGRQAGGSPSAAESLDQSDAGGHPAAQDVDSGAFVGKSRALRRCHFEIADDTAFVAIGGEIERVFGRGHGRLLGPGFVVENS